MASNITIIGRGHFGSALAHYLQEKTLTSVTVASRSTEVKPSEAVRNADIIILAIPAYAYHTTVSEILPNIRDGVTVIDSSNTPLSILPKRTASSVHTVRKMLPESVHVAKALNTISAIRLTELTEVESYTRSIMIPFASDEGAEKTVRSLISNMGFTPSYKGDLEFAEAIEAVPHTFFPAFKSTMILATIIWAWWILYSTLATYVIHGGRGTPSRPWDKYPLSMFMATTGETAQTLFAITFLAGPVATIFKSIGRPLGKTLIQWLDKRKQLGLAAFVFLSAHGIAGAISASHLDDGWKGQIYFVFGIL